MSFKRCPENEQLSIYDRTSTLSRRQRKGIEESWPQIFRDEIMPNIDEKPFAVLYSDNDATRPNTPVKYIIGSLILKELFNLSDDEIRSRVDYSFDVQYALGTTSLPDQPLSDKTLQRFRRRCLDYESETGTDLIHDCITSLSRHLAMLMGIKCTIRRMDSFMIASAIKQLSRTELLYTCISKVVKRLIKAGVEVPEELRHYADSDDFNWNFYYKKSDETGDTLDMLLADCDAVLNLCGDKYTRWKEYKNFKRCLGEQTVKEDEGRRLSTKEDGTLNSGVLQNPSDPDATFREKAGEEHRGYVTNVEESVGKDGSLVTDYSVEQNTYSDVQFMQDSLEKMEKNEEKVTMLTDGAYASQDNFDLAESKNVELVTTSLTGKETDDIYADFNMSEDGTEVESCPAGNEPIKQSYYEKTKTVRAVFDGTACANCPHGDECPAKLNSKQTKAVVMISKTSVNRAKAQRRMKGEDFKYYGRLRNGVETIPSIMRRKYHIDNTIRGLSRQRFFVGCKIGALNFNKFFRFRKGLIKCAPNPLLG